VKKNQLILLGSGALLFCLIYFLGTTVPPKDPQKAQAASPTEGIDFQQILKASKEQLNPSQLGYLSQLEAAVVKGDLSDQQARVYRKLAGFWKDSAHLLLPYSYYSGMAAKLENSEKSLTFAAHNFLEGLRRQSDPSLKKWMATEAKELFEKALKINPENDSTKVGLGSCYLFGQISENPLTGIQLIREVADRDPRNAYAQLMLGIGGLESGQFDKAIERFTKVLAVDPKQLEAILGLAECYERKGDKANAVKWYTEGRKYFTESEILQEIDARIDLLKK
jgi:tetratricopeptide (TPR) repeat protein